MNVRKASGRRVAGGRIIGRMAAFGALTAKGFGGWTGVPKAGEEDGIEEDGMGLCFRRNMGAGVLSIVNVLSLSTRHDILRSDNGRCKHRDLTVARLLLKGPALVSR